MLVVSRGDEQLVRLEGHRGWHFPRHEDGRFAGHHPENSKAAVTHLEELRAKGAEYLVFPETSLWWLDYYEGFRDHLEARYSLLGESASCRIYDVSGGTKGGVEDAATKTTGPGSDTPVREVVCALLPREATIAVLTTNSNSNALGDLDPDRTVRFEPPADDDSAAAEVDSLPRQGVEFLVVPRSAFTWLEMRPALRLHLLERHRFVTRQRHVCEIFELTGDRLGVVRDG